MLSGHETTERNLSYIVVKFKYTKGIYAFKVFSDAFVEFQFHWHAKVLLREGSQFCNPSVFHCVAL